MSATGRSDVRRPDDNYVTPAWCVERLLERTDLLLPAGRWLEPCAGEGGILNAVHAARMYCPMWTVCEIRPEAQYQLLQANGDLRETVVGDFLAQPVGRWRPRFDVVITNPPYSLAREFIDACLPLADHVVMLLRLNFLASAERHDLFAATHPDVYVLPNRPSFTPDGRTDATEYAWYHWHRDARGIVRVLGLTPTEQRKRRTA